MSLITTETETIKDGLRELGAELEKEETAAVSEERPSDLDVFMTATARHETPYLALITGHYELSDEVVHELDPTQLIFSVRSLNAMTEDGSIVLYGDHTEMLYNRVDGEGGGFAVLEKDLMTGSRWVKHDREIRNLFPGEVIFDVGLENYGMPSRETVKGISIHTDHIMVFKQMGATYMDINTFALPDWVL